MNIEEIREYCLAKPGVTEGFPFGQDVLVFKVMNKMFALTGLEGNPPYVNLKCDPERAIELREQYEEIKPGYHMNKEYWNAALDVPGAEQMKYLKNLMLSYPYFDRIPDQSLIAGNPGEKYQYLVGTRGRDYALVYTYTGRVLEIAMGKIEGLKVMASWYYPRNGDKDFMGEVDNTGARSFDPPGLEEEGNDWVLVLESVR